MFRQHPGWFVFFAGLAALTVVTIPLCLRDPEYRAAFFFVAQLQNAGGQVVTGSDTDGVDRGHPPGRGRAGQEGHRRVQANRRPRAAFRPDLPAGLRRSSTAGSG